MHAAHFVLRFTIQRVKCQNVDLTTQIFCAAKNGQDFLNILDYDEYLVGVQSCTSSPFGPAAGRRLYDTRKFNMC